MCWDEDTGVRRVQTGSAASLRSWSSLHVPHSFPLQSMVGSDTAELLMQDCRRQDKYRRQEPTANMTGLADEEWASRQPGTLDLITGEVPPIVETQAQIVEKFTKLLYYGRKKVSGEWDSGTVGQWDRQ